MSETERKKEANEEKNAESRSQRKRVCERDEGKKGSFSLISETTITYSSFRGLGFRERERKNCTKLK